MNRSTEVVREIEKRAYELFIARGGQHGYAMEDWLRAEKEVTGKTAKKPAKSGGSGKSKRR